MGKSADVEHDAPLQVIPAGEEDTDCDAGPNAVIAKESDGSAVQTPERHTELVPQDVLSLAIGLEHPPGLLHVPAVWQESSGEQETAGPATHVPLPLQASGLVQTLLSALHDVPLAALGYSQAPLDELHEPAVWHWFGLLHAMGSLWVHTPELQATLCMHGLVIMHPPHVTPFVPHAVVDCIAIGRHDVVDEQHPGHEVESQTH